MYVPIRKCLVLQLESVICVEQIRRVPSSYYMRSKHMKGNLNITCGAHLSDWQYRFLVKHLEFQPWESVIHRAIIIVRILTIHAYKIEIHWIPITFCIFKVLVSHLSFSLHVEVIKHKLFYNFYVVLFLQVIKRILQLWWTSSIDLSCLLCTSYCILNFWQISYCEDDSTIPFKIMHYQVLKKNRIDYKHI